MCQKLYLIKPEDVINERQIIDKVKLPCFVKPTDGGSSFGVTKVKKESELLPAIKEAFEAWKRSNCRREY